LVANELLVQLLDASGRLSTTKDPVRERAEREDVEALRVQFTHGVQLRREVDGALGLACETDLEDVADGEARARRRAQLALGDLPVEDPKRRVVAVGIADQDALRRERAVVEPPGMRVLQRLRDLPNERKTLAEIQLGPTALEEEVQPFGVRLVREDQCGASFVLGEALDPHDAGMLDAIEKTELPHRC